MLIHHLYIFFDEGPVGVFGPFFDWIIVFLLLSVESSASTPALKEQLKPHFEKLV